MDIFNCPTGEEHIMNTNKEWDKEKKEWFNECVRCGHTKPCYDYCPTGETHIFSSEHKEEWNEEKQEWKAFRECIRCDYRMPSFIISFCTKNKSKKHSFENNMSVGEKFGLTDHYKCKDCECEYTIPINNEHYDKWKFNRENQ